LEERKRVLIDCDPGIDDALALLFALASERLKVEAITTVYGNVSVEQCTENLKKILGLSGVKKFPQVGIGSDTPLRGEALESRTVHGRDGLGNVSHALSNIDLSFGDAVTLARSKILSGDVEYIIATGPLTNIAKLVTSDPKISDLVKRIYIMGGAVFVKGNVTPHAEFNIYNDPEAAKIVFDTKIPKVLVGLDVTHKAILEKKDLIELERFGNRLSRFIVDIAMFAITYHKGSRNSKGAYMNDPLCVGVAVDDGICEYGIGALDIVLKGPERGRIIAKNGSPKITYCKGVDVKRFKELFLTHLVKLSKEAVN